MKPLRDGPLIALGAHSDDLAFSLGAAFCNGRLRGCVPVTCFSRSGYSLTSPEGDITHVSVLRKGEDRVFFDMARLKAPLWLDLTDAPWRRNLAEESVFSLRMEQQEIEDVKAGLIPALPATGTLLAPLALGGHIDHRLVCQVACELHNQARYRVAFYEDLPYAAYMTMADITAAVRVLEHQLHSPLCALHLPSRSLPAIKQKIVEIYASQTDTHSLRPLIVHARRLAKHGIPVERIWIPAIADQSAITRVDHVAIAT